MKIKRVMIAAPKSGSGKTIVTCALLQALKDQGQQVVSYKCGPDYIDPMFHEQVIGIPAKNLDTFFTSEEDTRRLFLKQRTEKEFAVLEGVMGLFDGMGGIRKEGSSYHLAQVTKTPIVLVVDGKGMGRSIVPLLLGFLAYDRERLIQGVILNRVSKEYGERIKKLIEEELKLSVLGCIPEQKELQIASRHLGLVFPDRRIEQKEWLQRIAEVFHQSVTLEAIVEIAEKAEELSGKTKEPIKNQIKKERKPIVAVAKDEAFCFYYAENLLMLQEYGAEIRYFSPLHDRKLPDECDGLLLGGGYPELYAKGLSENKTMLLAIRQAVEGGMPLVAECGGFLYLHSVLVDPKGESYPMVGLVLGTCYYTKKLVRFGYIEVQDQKGYFLGKGGVIKGHEFHYYESSENGKDAFAVKPFTGRGYACIVEREHYWVGFPHLYYPSNPDFVVAFMEKVRNYKERKGVDIL